MGCWNDQLGNRGFLDNSEQRCSKLPHFLVGGVLVVGFRGTKRGNIKGSIKGQPSQLWRCSMVTDGLIGSKTGQSGVEVGSLSHYLQGFIHPRWLFGISELFSFTFGGERSACGVFSCFSMVFSLVFERMLLVHSILLVTDGFHFLMVVFFPFVTWQGEMFWTRWTS